MSLFQESIIRKHLGYLDQEVVEQAYLRFKEVYSANKITNIKVAKEEQYQEGFIKDIFGAVLGYSVNESVVVFDRVRETFRDRRYGKLAPAEVMNHAITSTISRTMITHGCTELMVLSMLIFGGPTLHFFALALTIGILFGIYSSVFVAAAVAMWLGVKREDLIKPVKVKDDTDGAVV
jgi:hypothetical protein